MPTSAKSVAVARGSQSPCPLWKASLSVTGLFTAKAGGGPAPGGTASRREESARPGFSQPRAGGSRPGRNRAQRLALTIARMPARTAGGRLDQASTTTARSRSAAARVGTFVGTSAESLPFPGETAVDSGLQIRHRRFDSDRSLSTEDPREVPVRPGFAGVFSLVGCVDGG